jgi:hypothetical protein
VFLSSAKEKGRGKNTRLWENHFFEGSSATEGQRHGSSSSSKAERRWSVEGERKKTGQLDIRGGIRNYGQLSEQVSDERAE